MDRVCLTISASIISILSIIIFLSITFASSPHKDFEHNLYYRPVPNGCEIVNSSLSEYWYTDVSCQTCGEAGSNEASCDSLQELWSQWDPMQCNVNTWNPNTGNNQQQCPIAQACGGGGFDSCSTCSYRICSGRSCSVYYYKCCECDPSYISNQACYITPSIGYRATIDILYTLPKINETIHTSTTQDFGPNEIDAQNYLKYDYQVDGTYTCYYNLDNHMEILFSLSYNVIPLVFAMIFAFLILLGFILLSISLFVYTIYDAALVFMAWAWIVGFFIFLPVSTAPNISLDGQLVLRIIGCQIISVGILPLIYLLCAQFYIYALSWSYVLIYYVPIGILIPLYKQILSNYSDDTTLIIYFVFLSFPSFIITILVFYFLNKFVTIRYRPSQVEIF